MVVHLSLQQKLPAETWFVPQLAWLVGLPRGLRLVSDTQGGQMQ